MIIYCIDTSALIAAWHERYPIENFPPFWDKMDGLISKGRLVAPIEVYHETGKRSDELHAWLGARKGMLRELGEDVQITAGGILMKFPRLVAKVRTSADPFVIAVPQVSSLQIVTDEKPTGVAHRPNIPDVVAALGLKPCMGLLDVIRAEKWVF
jgi:hypothetical protein